MQLIREEIKKEYLNFNGTFAIMFSGGKDSSLVLTLWWQALQEIPKELRTKQVYVISGDTMIETPLMANYVRKTLDTIEKQAEIDELPIVTRLVQPEMKNRYFFKLIGRGNLPPTPTSDKGRWCTGNLKQTPTQRVVEEILVNAPTDFSSEVIVMDNSLEKQFNQTSLDNSYKVHMSLGVRNEESARRRNSIDKHAFDKESKYAKHSDYKEILCYHPVKFVTNDELLFYFLELGTLPFGVTLEELEKQYGASFAECGLQHSKMQNKSCGVAGSRSGCWTCPLAKPDDPMLIGLIEEGKTSYSYLLDWKKAHIGMRNDVRYREVKRRVKENQHKKSHGINNKGQSSIFEMEQFEYQDEYYFENFKRANTDYDPGGFTVEARKILLEYLLYVQEKVGELLIEEEEILAILQAWKNTDDISIERDELVPKPFKFDGTIAFDSEGKMKKTNNPNSIFFIKVDMNMVEDDLVLFLKERQRITKQSLFCFPGFQEFKNEKLVWNTATFVVCREEIQTEQAAKELVWDWLWSKKPSENSMKFALRFLIANAIGVTLTKKYEVIEERESSIRTVKEVANNIPLYETEAGQLSLF